MVLRSDMAQKIRQYWSCLQGATVVEYSLIAAGMAIAILGSIFLFGDEMIVTLENLTNAFAGAQDRMTTPE